MFWYNFTLSEKIMRLLEVELIKDFYNNFSDYGSKKLGENFRNTKMYKNLKLFSDLRLNHC